MMVMVRPSGSGIPLSRLKDSQLTLERTSQSWLVRMVKLSGPPQAAKSLGTGVMKSLPLRACLMVMVYTLLMFSPLTVRVALRSSSKVLGSTLTTTSLMRVELALEEGVTVHQSAPLERVMVQGVLALTLKVTVPGFVAGRV